jgi:hypothetical protein
MRVIAAILFLLGIPWALFAWILIFGGPAAIVEEFQAGRMIDVLGLSLFWPLLAAHVGLGYYVWTRWFSITRDGSKSTRRFWLIASGHHLGWLALGGISCLEDDPLPSLMLGYAAVVFCVCVLGAIVSRPVPRRPRNVVT